MIRDDITGWCSVVIEDFPRNGVEIKLAQRRATVLDYVTEISLNTTLTSVPSGQDGPAGLLLSTDAARVLRDALSEFFGPPADDYRSRYEEARDALSVERQRFDALVARFPLREVRA